MTWVGGKKSLREEVVARFPLDYERYIEVFGGAGWVLFYKQPQSFEVYNDYNNNLVNLFRCVRDNPNKLKYKLRYYLDAREDYRWLVELHKRGLF
ncbi:MAG: DNA adenine methylase, partial [Clostridia bacterium]|nr:DNA adenine methylase [Clostridia bacterium]